MACCIGGTIAGPNPIYSKANVYASLDDGTDFADFNDEQNPADFFSIAAAPGQDSFAVGTNPISNDLPDFSLIGNAPGIDSFDQAFDPPSFSPFQTSFDDLFSAPSDTDYTAFSDQGDFGGFQLASAAGDQDQSNSFFGDFGDSGDFGGWNWGDADMFAKT